MVALRKKVLCIANVNYSRVLAYAINMYHYRYQERTPNMHLGLTNDPARFQQEMNRISRPLLGLELVLYSKEELDKDGGMVVVVYIDDILIATNGSLQKHHQQVSKVFQLLMDNNMCLEIDKCIFDAREVPFLGLMVS